MFDTLFVFRKISLIKAKMSFQLHSKWSRKWISMLLWKKQRNVFNAFSIQGGMWCPTGNCHIGYETMTSCGTCIDHNYPRLKNVFVVCSGELLFSKYYLSNRREYNMANFVKCSIIFEVMGRASRNVKLRNKKYGNILPKYWNKLKYFSIFEVKENWYQFLLGFRRFDTSFGLIIYLANIIFA